MFRWAQFPLSCGPVLYLPPAKCTLLVLKAALSSLDSCHFALPHALTAHRCPWSRDPESCGKTGQKRAAELALLGSKPRSCPAFLKAPSSVVLCFSTVVIPW